MTHPFPQPSDEAVERACHAWWAVAKNGSAARYSWEDIRQTDPGRRMASEIKVAITAAHAELVAEVERLKRARSNAEAQWRYMCKEISAAIGVNYDTPADATSAVRLVMQGAHVRDEQLSRLTAELAQRDEAGARDAEEVRQLRVLADEAWMAWDGDEDTRVGKFLHAMIDPAFRKTYRPDLSAAIDRAAEGKGDG